MTSTLFTDLVTRKLISGDGGAVTLPQATAVFDADDSRLSGALARINGKMLARQSRIAKFAAAFIAIRAVAGCGDGGIRSFVASSLTDGQGARVVSELIA